MMMTRKKIFSPLVVVALFSACVQCDQEVTENRYPQQYNGYQQAQTYGHHRYSKPHYFPPAYQVIDPKYYWNVMTEYKSCVTHKCKNYPNSYTTDYKKSLNALGKHTACVISCAAERMTKTVVDFKTLFAKLYDIGVAKLAMTRRYLAGKEDFNVIGNRTRIVDSCCLPKEYFAKWENIMFYATMYYDDGNGASQKKVPGDFLISAKDYLDYCSDKPSSQVLLYENLRVDCESGWVYFFEEMQKNFGHLILTPKAKYKIRNNGCIKKTEKFQHNPRAIVPKFDMCIATEICKNGETTQMTRPMMKKAIKNRYKPCPEDKETIINGGKIKYTIKYQFVPAYSSEYYSVSKGLFGHKNNACVRDFGLVGDDFKREIFPKNAKNKGLKQKKAPNDKDLRCLTKNPKNSRFEYCNMQQYAEFLQEELFDLSGCPLIQGTNPTVTTRHSLACLYRVATLQCDCMEAVLNCYEGQYHYSSTLGKTLGKASSILCGFIMCQRPSVYKLFGGQSAIAKAQIMKHLLLQVGAINADASALPPATIAFLSFGLGMMAFVVTKKIYKSSKSSVQNEQVYQNLI